MAFTSIIVCPLITSNEPFPSKSKLGRVAFSGLYVITTFVPHELLSLQYVHIGISVPSGEKFNSNPPDSGAPSIMNISPVDA